MTCFTQTSQNSQNCLHPQECNYDADSAARPCRSWKLINALAWKVNKSWWEEKSKIVLSLKIGDVGYEPGITAVVDESLFVWVSATAMATSKK